MNEKAIRVAYELFVADGYTRSINDFKNLMRDNPKGREVAYNLFVNDGYNKSINDFAVLMGATESLDETPQPDVKKKVWHHLRKMVLWLRQRLSLQVVHI